MTYKNGDMPAMPVDQIPGYSLGGSSPNGLTKREYFAGLAMQGLCSHSGDYHEHDHLACDAVRIADALLDELECTNDI